MNVVDSLFDERPSTAEGGHVVPAVDDRREALLAIQDAAVRRRFPGAEYRDPRIRRGRIVRGTGGGNYQEHR